MSARAASDVRGADPSDGADWLTEREMSLLRTIRSDEAPALASATDALMRTIEAGGVIHVAATGHGLALVLESFHRAGGLACVSPIWDPRFLPISGAREATAAERTVGLGGPLAEGAAIEARDSLIAFSQSGANVVPIEVAAAARSAGATVIVVTSREHGAAVPTRDPAGRRLADLADIVIDTHVPAGDAVFRADPAGPTVAALSTIAGVHVWNLLLVGLAERSRAKGVELPVWISSSMPGGDERNAELIARYANRVSAL